MRKNGKRERLTFWKKSFGWEGQELGQFWEGKWLGRWFGQEDFGGRAGPGANEQRCGTEFLPLTPSLRAVCNCIYTTHPD